MSAPPTPITIGRANCESMCGVPWRWLREHAGELGIPLVTIDGKTVMLAMDVVQALRVRVQHTTASETETPVDVAGAVRAKLGLVRRAE